MLLVQYERILLKAVTHITLVPLAIEVYEEIMPIFEIALGVYYQSSYYVAKRPVYKSETVHFDRFCYDLISMFGVNILFIELESLEHIIRKIYKCVSYNFDNSNGNEGIQLKSLECIEEAFTMKDF